MDTEDWILKGTKLITNTKKQRLKIQSRCQTLKKYNIKKKSQRLQKLYMKFALKIGSFFFFCKVIGYIKEEEKETERKKKKSHRNYKKIKLYVQN